MNDSSRKMSIRCKFAPAIPDSELQTFTAPELCFYPAVLFQNGRERESERQRGREKNVKGMGEF